MPVIQAKNDANDKPKSDQSFYLLRDHFEDFLFTSLQQIAQTAQAQVP
jgi:hypothetical protein